MEKDILKINALVMLTSMVVTLVTTLLLNNLGLTVVSIVILLALRSIIAELILSKKTEDISQARHCFRVTYDDYIYFFKLVSLYLDCSNNLFIGVYFIFVFKAQRYQNVYRIL